MKELILIDNLLYFSDEELEELNAEIEYPYVIVEGNKYLIKSATADGINVVDVYNIDSKCGDRSANR